ncbi:hypothetical protein EVG18_02230 [Burkholderia pyrrocinia]|nr:hypothetical protein EVG18_02230 [Burkholderia pyrrocinia]
MRTNRNDAEPGKKHRKITQADAEHVIVDLAQRKQTAKEVRTESWTTLEVVHVFVRRPRSNGSALHQIR